MTIPLFNIKLLGTGCDKRQKSTVPLLPFSWLGFEEGPALLRQERRGEVRRNGHCRSGFVTVSLYSPWVRAPKVIYS